MLMVQCFNVRVRARFKKENEKKLKRIEFVFIPTHSRRSYHKTESSSTFLYERVLSINYACEWLSLMESWWFYVGKSGKLTTLTLWRHDDSSSLRSHSLPLHNFAHQNNPSTWCTKMHFWLCINLSSLLLFIYHRDNMNAYLEKSRAVFFVDFVLFLAVGLFAATCTHSIVSFTRVRGKG